MPRPTRRATLVAAAVALSACGGGSGTSSGPSAPSTAPRLGVTAPPDDAIAFTDPVYDVARLGQADMCSLLTAADVTEVVGGTPEPQPEYTRIEGLTTACARYDAETFALSAKVEIGEIAFADLILLYVFDDATPYADCEVAGLTAICVEPHESAGFEFGANVAVQLGEPQGPALLVEAPTVEQAAALATIAIERLAELDI